MSRISAMAALCAGTAFALGSVAPVKADLVNLGPDSFTAAAPEITFGEFTLGTVNPTKSFVGLTDLGDITVSFAGTFVGQTTSGTSVITLADHVPSGPLALNLDGAETATVNDSASNSSPVLSGTPRFNGPISVLFSKPVAGVGLKGGAFDALNATTIEAYDVNGNVLGAITNSKTGFEFYGLADSSKNPVIAGISFFITGNEPAGFEIDNLTFGGASTVVTPEPPTAVPLPPALLTGMATLVALGGGNVLRARRR